MVKTARPVTAPGPHLDGSTTCPECGTPVSGIAAVEPGRHEFAACGHPVVASVRSLLEPGR